MFRINNLFSAQNGKIQKSPTEIRRTEEVAEEIKKGLKTNPDSRYLYLTDCYAKNGEIYIKNGKTTISPEFFTQCLDEEALRVYNTAVRNNTTMSNARLIIKNNARFVDNFNECPIPGSEKFYPKLHAYLSNSGKIMIRQRDFKHTATPKLIQEISDKSEAYMLADKLRGSDLIKKLKDNELQEALIKLTSCSKTVSKYLSYLIR